MIDNDRLSIAQNAFEDYDFGDGVTITDSEGWDTSDQDDLTKVAYAEFGDDEKRFRNFYDCPECGASWDDEHSSQCDSECPVCGLGGISPTSSEDGDMTSHKVSFHVRFHNGGSIEAYALLVSSGNYIGTPKTYAPPEVPGVLEGGTWSLMMGDLIGEYGTPEGVPEWEWVERNASYAHTHNGEDGIWEFLLNLACDFEDAPANIAAVIEKARGAGAHYVLFHQGT